MSAYTECVWTLACDTSTAAITVGVVDLPTHFTFASHLPTRVQEIAALPHAVRVTRDPRAHNETLLPMLRECCTECDVSLTDLAAIVAGVGPGPFTGLRVGLATADALSEALNIPRYATTSLDAIALAALAREERAESVLIASDARRREVYWGVYSADGVCLRLPAVQKPASIGKTLTEEGATPVYARGPAAELYSEELADAVTSRDVRDQDLSVPALIAPMCESVQQSRASDALTPLYLRRPDVTLSTQ